MLLVSSSPPSASITFSFLFLLSDETLTSEVESWTTGEQLASWLLLHRWGFFLVDVAWRRSHAADDCGRVCLRGVSEAVQGWTVSLLTDDGWSDLAGSDFVMDLLGAAEMDGGSPTWTPSSRPSSFLFSQGDRLVTTCGCFCYFMSTICVLFPECQPQIWMITFLRRLLCKHRDHLLMRTGSGEEIIHSRVKVSLLLLVEAFPFQSGTFVFHVAF